MDKKGIEIDNEDGAKEKVSNEDDEKNNEIKKRMGGKESENNKTND